MNNVNLTKGKQGVSIIGASDGISGLLATAVAIAGTLDYGTVYTIYKLEDAEAIGITEEYDTVNNVRLYRHISEVYRMGEEGTKMYLMIAPQSVSMIDLIDIEGVYSKSFIAQTEGDISLFGVSVNPVASYVPTIVDGMNADVVAAIAKAQAFSDWCLETNRPLGVVLEGRDYSGTGATVLNLRAILNLEAENVLVVSGQDWDYAETQNDTGKKFADIGTYLGSLQKIAVHENPGEVETMNLTDATLGVWMTAGLSSHQKTQDVEADLDTLNTKGHVFAYTDTNFAGYRWNDDPTCTPVIIDNDGNMNQHQFSYVRAWNKAYRLLRAALIPKVKSTHKLSPEGKLAPGIVKYFEGIGDDALTLMIRAGELSDGKATVDKESDLTTPPKSLDMSFVIQPLGTIGEINGVINIKKSL